MQRPELAMGGWHHDAQRSSSSISVLYNPAHPSHLMAVIFVASGVPVQIVKILSRPHGQPDVLSRGDSGYPSDEQRGSNP
jgi:hypothetical protein